MPRSTFVFAALLAALIGLPAFAQKPAPGKEHRAKKLFVEALTKSQIGNHEAALKLYEKALKQAPGNPAILQAAAEAYQATGDTEAALLYARQAARQGTDRPRYGRRLAALLANLNRPDEAAEAYRRVLERFPNDRPALRAMARLYTEQERPGDALRIYARLLEAGADSAAVLARMTPLYANNPEAARLDRKLRDALNAERPARAEASPGADDETSLVARARKLRTENPARARRLLRRAVEADSQPEALGMLGALLFKKGAYAEAADYLTQAVEQNPRDAMRWQQAAEALLRSDQPAEALRAADDGLLLFPGRLPLLKTSAQAALAVGKPASALDRANEALDVLSESSAARTEQQAVFYVIKGDALSALDRKEEARAARQRARRFEADGAEVQK